jgi:hypothetical protein
VRDPELDESITDLGFVAGVEVTGTDVAVRLRLPTYFCAPNFAYLMVADAHVAVAAVPGVGSVTVQLLDHFASEEINGGVAAGAGFTGSFPGLADGELAELRAVFQRKAHTAAQEAVAARLQREGHPLQRLAAATLADAGEGPDTDRLRRRRADLGLPATSSSPLLVDDDGRALPEEQLPLRLRFARTTRVSIEGNGALCRGLLAVRYPQAPADAGDVAVGRPRATAAGPVTRVLRSHPR